MVAITGCETEKIVFTGPYHVRFTEASGFQKESYSSVIPIEVHLAGPAVDENLSISYKISGTAREGVDYVILSDPGKVTIDDGEYFGNIVIQLINNSNNILRSQDIVFTLIGVSGASLDIGQGPSAIGREYTFTIIDDCILGGTYNAKRGSTQVPGVPITSQDCKNYTVANWNINVFDSSVPMDLTFVDNYDNTITIPEQKESELPANRNTIKGKGTVDPTTKRITLEITLVDFDATPIEFEITYEPQ